MNEYIYGTDCRGSHWLTGEKIVRCRDCKHLDEIRVSYSAEPVFQCKADWCQGVEGDSPLVEPNGFCAWGERRSDDR